MDIVFGEPSPAVREFMGRYYTERLLNLIGDPEADNARWEDDGGLVNERVAPYWAPGSWMWGMRSNG